MNKSKYFNGFTLIEILIVIAIIGVLSTLIFMNVANASKKSRDAKRSEDALTIKKGMDLYFNDNNGYINCPAIGGGGYFLCGNLQSGIDGLTPYNLLKPYIGQLPTDPNPENEWMKYYRISIKGNKEYYSILVPYEIPNTRGCYDSTNPDNTPNGNFPNRCGCQLGNSQDEIAWNDGTNPCPVCEN